MLSHPEGSRGQRHASGAESAPVASLLLLPGVAPATNTVIDGPRSSSPLPQRSIGTGRRFNIGMEVCRRSINSHHHHRRRGGGGDGGDGAVPFVLKTYRMVEDPSTDGVISWGRHNNSFVVVDTFTFSQTLLPSHFKHGNFSSFIRQLNTYGFRKVDPDRWEFAHESFLRGQTHLLKHIVRRSGGGVKKEEEEAGEKVLEGEEEERVAAEVVRLKQEQRRIEERMQGLWRRVEETEQRPRQILGFLVKVVGDPGLADRRLGRLDATEEGGEKRARLRSGTAEEGGGGGGGVDWGWHLGEQSVCGGDGHREFRGGINDLDPLVRFHEYFGAGGIGATSYPCSFHAGNGF